MKGADTEVGERRRVVDKVMNVVRQRFAHEYRRNGKPIAEAVAKGKVLSLTTIGNELGKLKKLNEAFSLETALISSRFGRSTSSRRYLSGLQSVRAARAWRNRRSYPHLCGQHRSPWLRC